MCLALSHRGPTRASFRFFSFLTLSSGFWTLESLNFILYILFDFLSIGPWPNHLALRRTPANELETKKHKLAKKKFVQNFVIKNNIPKAWNTYELAQNMCTNQLTVSITWLWLLVFLFFHFFFWPTTLEFFLMAHMVRRTEFHEFWLSRSSVQSHSMTESESMTTFGEKYLYIVLFWISQHGPNLILSIRIGRYIRSLTCGWLAVDPIYDMSFATMDQLMQLFFSFWGVKLCVSFSKYSYSSNLEIALLNSC